MSISSFQILVVEDNPNSRETVCEMLAALGHGATSAASAEEALKVLKNAQFDVLIADINLPGMSGIELAETALKDQPGIKVIFASGYGYLVADKTDFDFVLLPKPYGFPQLKHALDAVFASDAKRAVG